jgi:hypothetical protein
MLLNSSATFVNSGQTTPQHVMLPCLPLSTCGRSQFPLSHMCHRGDQDVCACLDFVPLATCFCSNGNVEVALRSLCDLYVVQMRLAVVDVVVCVKSRAGTFAASDTPASNMDAMTHHTSQLSSQFLACIESEQQRRLSPEWPLCVFPVQVGATPTDNGMAGMARQPGHGSNIRSLSLSPSGKQA